MQTHSTTNSHSCHRTTNLQPLLNVTVVAQPGSISFCESAYSQRSHLAVSLIYRVYVTGRQTNLHYGGQATEFGFLPKKPPNQQPGIWFRNVSHGQKNEPLHFSSRDGFNILPAMKNGDLLGTQMFKENSLASHCCWPRSHSHDEIQLQVVPNQKEWDGFWLILSTADECISEY